MVPLIYAGIDEAGYGPMFGPLVVACAAFTLHAYEPSKSAPNLWKLLARAVCRSRSDRRRRIAVEDSKSLKGPVGGAVHPLRHLERGVLAFRASSPADIPANDAALLDQLHISQPAHRWYDGAVNLPVGQSLHELQIAIGMLKRAMTSCALNCPMMQAEVIDAGTFNSQIDVMHSKAAVNLCAAMRLVDAVWRRWPDAHPRIVVDRQSGRTHYLRPLQLSYPDAELTILNEDERFSRYHLRRGSAELTITFTTEAERQHLPVALASMTAKYVRELLMLRMNRFFRSHMPELKPTAGYVQDGRRYLADIEPLIRRLGLDRRQLVRES